MNDSLAPALLLVVSIARSSLKKRPSKICSPPSARPSDDSQPKPGARGKEHAGGLRSPRLRLRQPATRAATRAATRGQPHQMNHSTHAARVGEGKPRWPALAVV